MVNHKSLKRLHPAPDIIKERLDAAKSKTATYACSLLNKSLTHHGCSKSMKESLFSDLSSLLHVDVLSSINLDETDPIKDQSDNVEIIEERRVLIKRNKSSTSDLHNEICEVCNAGGDLLCCDTCTLVFHLRCLRPKLTTIPKSEWSCAYCISEKLVPGDSTAARLAVRQMKALSQGLDLSTFVRSSSPGDVHIMRSNKQFVLRTVLHGQQVDIGRYDSIEDALDFLKKEEYLLNEAQIEGVDDPLAHEATKYTKLLCSYCLDDTQIELCSFCGCRICFGKHDPDFLISCDSCEQRFHSYCLSPSPDEYRQTWHCQACSHTKQASTKIMSSEVSHPSAPSSSAIAHTDVSTKLEIPKAPSRGRGRPLGSTKKNQVDGSILQRLQFRQLNAASVPKEKASYYGIPGVPSGDEIVRSIDVPMNVIGVDSVLQLVSKLGSTLPKVAEKEVLHYFRETAPVFDLITVRDALITQKDRLLALIRENGDGPRRSEMSDSMQISMPEGEL